MYLYEAFLTTKNILKTHNKTSATLDTEVLLMYVLQQNKTWIHLNLKTYQLTPSEQINLQNYLIRRTQNEPIAYITQQKEFYGINFFVNHNVLIPRPETEIIVEQILNDLQQTPQTYSLLDIGTGSGCIPLSIIKNTPPHKKLKQIYLNDISKTALEVAQKNIQILKIPQQNIHFINGDLQQALHQTSNIDNLIITANLPYINPSKYIKLKNNVKKFEPAIALIAPEKGLRYLTQFITTFSTTQHSNYIVILEMDPDQIQFMKNFIQRTIQKSKVTVIKDLHNKQRFIKLTNTL